MAGAPDWAALMRQALAAAKARARQRRRLRRRMLGGGDHGQSVTPPPIPGNPNAYLWPDGSEMQWPDGSPVEFR
jgi:hypothetical protein